jgi:pimeloyl-ACP methyl ester carboxylesterase
MPEHDEGAGIIVDLESSSPVTVVAFAGLNVDGPRFEFFRFLSGLDVRRVFVRDLDQVWYQLGVHGVSDTVDGVETHLRELLGEDGIRRAVFTGGSMGGYAAMLLGSRLGVAEVHAFSPQTFISRILRRYYKDFRWQKQVNHTWASIDKRHAYLDIKPELRRAARRQPVPLHLHVGPMPRDLQHVNRLRRIAGIEVHRYDELATHNVAGELHAAGRLQPLFEAAVARAAHTSVPVRESRRRWR